MIKLLLTAILVFCANTLYAQDIVRADSLYSVAQAAYEEGDFERAELTALRGLRELEGGDDLDKLKFHLLLGFLYVARDQRDAAMQEFTRVVSLNPALELDPVQTSPKIREVFDSAKNSYLLRIKSEPLIYRLPQADVRIAASRRSAVIPGWGQFYKEQDVKGAVFIAAQILSLAVLIAAQSEVNRRHDDYVTIRNYNDPRIEDRYADYRRAYQTRNVVGYVTLGIYVVNYLDALYTPVFRNK